MGHYVWGNECLMFNLSKTVYISVWFVLNASDLFLFPQFTQQAGRLLINQTGKHNHFRGKSKIIKTEKHDSKVQKPATEEKHSCTLTCMAKLICI